jgi:transcription antitermination factor NusA-like protein
MQLIADEKRVNIIVDEDQLSLAIGKYGQNVRLASKLVGWELDIYSAKQWEEKQKTTEGAAPETVTGALPADVTPSDEDSKEEEEQE